MLAYPTSVIVIESGEYCSVVETVIPTSSMVTREAEVYYEGGPLLLNLSL